MTATAQLSKLAELRAKTDQELVSIINNALDAGLLLAANEAHVDPDGVLHRRAVDIYADTVMLVQKVEDVGERRRLEERLKQFQESLERRQVAAARVASKLNQQRAAVGCI
jgi:translation initiation factor 2 gamma subunit (eIF-2gamma)